MNALGAILQQDKRRGFTIVELLIVIVVIAILAAISVVAYNGIQERARDAQREQDVKVITKALEMYYIDNGQYPQAGGSTTLNSHWSTTVDSSWNNLASALVPQYISKLPVDPINSGSANPGSNNYSYFTYNIERCGAPGPYQFYRLYFRYETKPQTMLSGSNPCNSGTSFSTYGSSYYTSVK